MEKAPSAPRLAVYLLLAIAAAAPALTAEATNCSQYADPIYVAGIKPPFMPGLAGLLAKSGSTIVFGGSNDCGGLKNILPADGGGIPMAGTGAVWDMTQTEDTCDLPLTGVQADVAITGLFPALCASSLGLSLPANAQDTQGPVIPYMFVTPLGSGAPPAISAEQAYYVYGFGFYGGIAPWNNGNQQMLNLTFAAGQSSADVIEGVIGLLPSSMLARVATSAADMISSLTSASPQSAAIGMMGSDLYDVNRDVLKALAFRGYGQDFAWTPDADGGMDKRNVREGRYVMYAPLHFVTLGADGGQAETAGGQTIREIVDGTTALPIDIAQLAVASHIVPACAMKYERAQDGLDPVTHYGLVPSSRTQSCDCYFDSLTGTSQCPACMKGACPPGLACHRGLCEAF